MRQRPGRMRNIRDLRYQFKGLHEVVVPNESPMDISYGTYIRENCRRADWSSEYRSEFNESRSNYQRIFVFVDSTDAIAFKMRFG